MNRIRNEIEIGKKKKQMWSFFCDNSRDNSKLATVWKCEATGIILCVCGVASFFCVVIFHYILYDDIIRALNGTRVMQQDVT
jgi:hypothetical protein